MKNASRSYDIILVHHGEKCSKHTYVNTNLLASVAPSAFCPIRKVFIYIQELSSFWIFLIIHARVGQRRLVLDCPFLSVNYHLQSTFLFFYFRPRWNSLLLLWYYFSWRLQRLRFLRFPLLPHAHQGEQRQRQVQCHCPCRQRRNPRRRPFKSHPV